MKKILYYSTILWYNENTDRDSIHHQAHNLTRKRYRMKKSLLCFLLLGSLLLTSCGSLYKRTVTFNELYDETRENASSVKQTSATALEAEAPGTWVDPAKLPTASKELIGVQLTISVKRGISEAVVFAYSPANEKGEEQLLLIYSPDETSYRPIILSLKTSYGSMEAFLAEKNAFCGVVRTIAIGADDYPYNLNSVLVAKEEGGKVGDASSEVVYGMLLPKDGAVVPYVFDSSSVYTKNFERTLERFHIPAMKKS